MSARAERIIPAKKIKVEKVIIGFDPEKLKAPFLLRCGALLIDYILLISIPVLSILAGRMNGDDGARLLNNELSNGGWIIVLLLAVTNFIIFPAFGGQSVGKMIAGIEITGLDGSTPGFGRLTLRHLLGYPLTLLTGGLGYIFLAFNKKGRSLHDYVAGTVVVYGRKTVSRKRVNQAKKGKRTTKTRLRNKREITK